MVFGSYDVSCLSSVMKMLQRLRLRMYPKSDLQLGYIPRLYDVSSCPTPSGAPSPTNTIRSTISPLVVRLYVSTFSPYSDN